MAIEQDVAFTARVRDALMHLHDLPYLQLHPLARRLRAGGAAGAGAALQRLLLDAIDEQRPAGVGPAVARARRRHELLTQRYVEAQDVRTVGSLLGLSRSEYHREHRLALDALADRLGDVLAAPAAPEEPPAAFVGRDRELDQLLDRFASARASRGQVVLVEGDPGIGKSRLLRELRSRLEGEAPTWLVGRCVSHGRDIAYYPIVDLLKTRFGIEPSDGESAIVGKIERALATPAGRPTGGWPFLRYLLSVDSGDPAVARLDPAFRKARIFEAVRALLLAVAATRP